MGDNNDSKPADFKRSYGGVFAPDGYWENADGELKKITEMDRIHKLRTIKHIFTALPSKDDTGLIVFSGRYADSIAKKLKELGCEVNLIENEFMCSSNQREY
ncbi:hypothetical protein [Paenibacillus sp. FSL L8-0494]|uniref:hypothetical protein n=1 Tax=Paenibacillus sp. FSL L8-0494 TaxID=2975352 RepID=UPI0030F7F28D